MQGCGDNGATRHELATALPHHPWNSIRSRVNRLLTSGQLIYKLANGRPTQRQCGGAKSAVLILNLDKSITNADASTPNNHGDAPQANELAAKRTRGKRPTRATMRLCRFCYDGIETGAGRATIISLANARYGKVLKDGCYVPILAKRWPKYRDKYPELAAQIAREFPRG
jgi:hypothetical protein